MSATLDQARRAKEQVARMLCKVSEVNGIGITGGDQGYAVKVNLTNALPPGTELPSEVDGVPVVVEVVGVIRKSDA